MKLLIARKLQQIPLPTSGGTATAPPAVWVRQIRKDDSGGFEFVGNAFQVKDKDVQNIDDPKKVIETAEKLSIAPSKIEIYSQEDGKWSKEGKMSAPLRDNDEDAPYGYIVP
ncbi:N-acetyltransferase domain-containing protein [Durusdinium trenchii]